jgi:hypothetical protein
MNDPNSQDQIDNGYAYKNEISLSIGGDDNSSTTNETASVPTPSPRQNMQCDSPNEQLIHGRHNGGDDLHKGVDNLAYESEPTLPRPLSSFGHNGTMNDYVGVKKPNGNSSSSQKPAAGKFH